MLAGWRSEIRDSNYDYLLVLNDDVLLFPDSIQTLIDVARMAVQAGCCTIAVAANFTDGKSTTYGALRRSSRFNPVAFKQSPAPSTPQLAHTLNMNCALISRCALDTIGFLSPVFRHTGGDYDFGLRLRRAGGQVWQAPGHQGYCERNSICGSSMDSSLSVATRVKRLLGVKEAPLVQRATYAFRHGGLAAPLVFVSPYVRLLASAALNSPACMQIRKSLTLWWGRR